jgi:hypothetical protein
MNEYVSYLYGFYSLLSWETFLSDLFYWLQQVSSIVRLLWQLLYCPVHHLNVAIYFLDFQEHWFLYWCGLKIAQSGARGIEICSIFHFLSNCLCDFLLFVIFLSETSYSIILIRIFVSEMKNMISIKWFFGVCTFFLNQTSVLKFTMIICE